MQEQVTHGHSFDVETSSLLEMGASQGEGVLVKPEIINVVRKRQGSKEAQMQNHS